MKFDEALCPCESGKQTKDCCLTSTGSLWPKPHVPALSRPPTGIKNPKCYASERADCSEQLSREHYISHGILKELSDDGINVVVEGFSWLKDDEKRNVPTRRLGSFILCKRHNHALRGFDTIAKRFFSRIDTIDQGYVKESAQKAGKVFLFNGNDIERWMLKTLCGLVYSGNSSSRSGPIPRAKPDIRVLKVLFAHDRFPAKLGLYSSANIGKVDNFQRSLEFALLSNNKRSTYGLIVLLNRKRFILTLVPPPTRKDDNLLSGYIYRPDHLLLTDGKTANIIAFGWDVRGQGGRIVIRYKKRGLE